TCTSAVVMHLVFGASAPPDLPRQGDLSEYDVRARALALSSTAPPAAASRRRAARGGRFPVRAPAPGGTRCGRSTGRRGGLRSTVPPRRRRESARRAPLG